MRESNLLIEFDFLLRLLFFSFFFAEGIPPHVDTHSAFEDGIVSLSLGSQVNAFV